MGHLRLQLMAILSLGASSVTAVVDNHTVLYHIHHNSRLPFLFIIYCFQKQSIQLLIICWDLKVRMERLFFLLFQYDKPLQQSPGLNNNPY